MPTIRERLIDVIGGAPYRRRQEEIARLLEKAYRHGPALVPTQMMFDRLGEVDERLLDLWIRQSGYQLLNGRWIGQYELTEQDRLRVVEQSRWQYHLSAQYENAITMWTDFGFGQQVKIVPVDDKAATVWGEAFTARRNVPLFKQRKLHELSNDVLIDGELFIAAYANTVDGRVTYRRFATDAVEKVIYDREDTDVPVWYKVKVAKTTDNLGGVVYFPDWQASAQDRDQEWERILAQDRDAKQASDLGREIELNGEQVQATDAVMLQVAPVTRNGRGWPKMYRFIEWDDSLRRHIGDHLAVAKAVATFVDEVVAKGGSRSIDEITAKFASSLSTGSTDWIERNPSPAAGSVLTHNDAVTVDRRPLATGASDAQATSGLVAGQMSAASKTPLHWMGYPRELANRATARETDRPFIQQMERYQQFWGDVLHDLVGIALMFAEKYGSETFATDEVDVKFESPQLIPPEEIAAIIKAITDAMTKGAVDAGLATNAVNWLVSLSLVNLGARNVDTILEADDGDEMPEPDEDATATERLAAVIRANAEGGTVGWQEVAEWAMSEMVA